MMKLSLSHIYQHIMHIYKSLKTKLYPHWFVRNKDMSALLKAHYALANALSDPKGLGKLELMLHNAHIPSQHYDIFYKMFALQFTQGGGQR